MPEVLMTAVNNFTEGYLRGKSIFVGSGLSKRLAADGFASQVPIKAGEVDTEATIQPTHQMSGMTEVIRELGLEPGDRILLEWTRDEEETWLSIKRRPGDFGHSDSVDDDVVNHASDAFSQTESKLVVVSVVDGPPGVKGGVNTASHLILRALDQAGHSVMAATSDPLTAGEIEGVSYVPIGSTKIDDFLDEGDVEAPRWVIGHGVWTGLLARSIAEDRDIRRLHVVHTSPTHIASARGGVSEGAKALKKIAQEADLIQTADLCAMVGNSKFDFGHIAPDRSLPLNFQMSTGASASPNELPARYPGVNVLIIGRLDDAKVKGLDVAMGIIEASDDYRTVDRSPLFFTASGVPSYGSLDELDGSKEAGRSRYVELPALSQDEVADQITKSSVVILPSGADAFGLVALEALSLGRPCVVSHLAGIAQLYRAAGFGQWVVDTSEPEKWLTKIIEMVHSESDLRRAMGDADRLFREINSLAGRSMIELADRMSAEV